MIVENGNLKDHLIRVYDLTILGIAYLILGLLASYLINKYSSEYNVDASTGKLILEIILEVGVTIIFSYFIHIIVEKLPLPMTGTKQVRTEIIRQVRGGIILAFAMFTLQVKLRAKVIGLLT
jgi:hypothetical protein